MLRKCVTRVSQFWMRSISSGLKTHRHYTVTGFTRSSGKEYLLTDKPDYILEPRYILELYFARTGTKVRVDDPALINEEIIARAWNTMSDFTMDVVDELQLEATD